MLLIVEINSISFEFLLMIKKHNQADNSQFLEIEHF